VRAHGLLFVASVRQFCSSGFGVRQVSCGLADRRSVHFVTVHGGDCSVQSLLRVADVLFPARHVVRLYALAAAHRLATRIVWRTGDLSAGTCDLDAGNQPHGWSDGRLDYRRSGARPWRL